MNIVVENIWDYVQNNPNLTRRTNSPTPTSSQYIVLNTMADLCLGGELWSESLNADFGIDGMDGGGGGGGKKGGAMRTAGRNKMMRRERRGVMRSGMMRSAIMKKTLTHGSGGGLMGQHGLVNRHNDAGVILGDGQKNAIIVPDPPEEKMTKLECFDEIVSTHFLHFYKG